MARRTMVVSFMAEPGELKRNAVFLAVQQQLAEENKRPFNTDFVMNSQYRYNEDTIENFLASVADRLSRSMPPLIFEYDDAFRTAALSKTVRALIAAIVSKSAWGN